MFLRNVCGIVRTTRHESSHMFRRTFLTAFLLLGLHFIAEDGGYIRHRNVPKYVLDYTDSDSNNKLTVPVDRKSKSLLRGGEY
jgi:hypothetical protein